MDNINIQNIKQRFGIIGNSEALTRAIEIAAQVATTDLSVLITGESGVGKENIAKIIHSYSARKHNTYIAVNCGAIPKGTMESELFGHEKGSYTDAKNERKGYFEVAEGGTIFLDEIGELPLDVQAKLLRVLENKEFMRVGSSKVQKSNVRVIAATNVKIDQAIYEGRFRQDLYYRLNTIPINIPALRDRKEDINLLFRKFANDIAEKYRRPVVKLDDEASLLLSSYYWPGNVRQLKNIAEQLSVLETGVITKDVLERYLPDSNVSTLPMISSNKNDSGQQSFENEREILYQVLFDMKKDISDLKTAIKEIISKQGINIGQSVAVSTEIIPPSASTFKHTSTPSTSINIARSVVTPESSIRTPTALHSQNPIEDSEIVEESLSLEEVGKDVIIKALKKHGGKRKEAARELNISERTLYRKIKKFGLDN